MYIGSLVNIPVTPVPLGRAKKRCPKLIIILNKVPKKGTSKRKLIFYEGGIMLTAAQLRAARGLLDWTRADLAKAANLSPETIKNIEHGSFRPQESTSAAIVRAFASFGVEFTENEGVIRRRDSIVRYEGAEEFKRFMDDVYRIASDPIEAQKPICVSNVDDRIFIKYLGAYADLHVNRMNELNKQHRLVVKVLTGENSFYKAPEGHYLEYRWHPRQEDVSVPFYVYGDKLAIIVFGQTPDPQVLVISSAMVAKAYRDQFDILWNDSHK